jgi:hypothetical protein
MRFAREKGWGYAGARRYTAIDFYVSGFDPFPLRRYRFLYRKEAKR